MDHQLIFYGLLFLVAFLYASVGHGGASGYLALMALFSFTPEVMKPTALLLNLFVSLISFYQFYRGKHFQWKTFFPLAMASVPFAFLGGMISIDASLYKRLLGFLLLLPIFRLLFFKNVPANELRKPNLLLSLQIGSTIGFLSGLIGIGGGIILSPVLLLLKWTDQKQTAAISALFIFVNSLSGLSGQLVKGISFSSDMAAYVVIAFAGGLLGSFLGARRFNQDVIKYMLSVVLIVAAYKLLFTAA
jgi:uncharacterized membrane protein YfcA